MRTAKVYTEQAAARLRSLVLSTLVAVSACGPTTGGRLLADPAVLEAIRRYYDANAREDPSCGDPFITRLERGSAHPVAVMGAPVQVIVDYRWEAPPLSPDAPRCAGEGRRSFWILPTASGPKVTAMSGPTRPRPSG